MKTRITVTIDQALKDKVQEVADIDRRDLSAEICVLIEEALVSRGKRRGA